MIPVISFVGYSNSGKTTFLNKLIQELKRRQYCVAVVKHDGHDFSMDVPGTDTWKHWQAGADMVAIASATKMAVLKKASVTLEELIGEFQGADLILTEGFKKEGKPQIEVNRQGVEPLGVKINTIAVVSDGLAYEGLPRFSLEEVQKVADFLETRYHLRGKRQNR